MTETVAIIGSGIAGLTAAHSCRQAGFRVTLFEAQAGHGMDAHSIKLDGGRVDVPLRVMGDGAWRDTLALAGQADLDTFVVEPRISCSWSDRQTWLRSGRMPLTRWPTIGSWRYANRHAFRIARGLARLSKQTRQLRRTRPDTTLGEFIGNAAPDPLFWRGLVLPILSTICTCDEKHLLAWPAAQILSLMHGILHEQTMMRLHGGTSAFASALTRDIPCHNGSPVTRVRAQGDALSVENARGDGGRFQRVIVATPANRLDFLDPGHFGHEQRVLQGIPYARGELVVHRDERFMPRARRDWTALNFQMDRRLDQSMFTVWVNAIEPSLSGQKAVFQTWNPLFEPIEETVLGCYPMQRAVVNGGTARIHQQLHAWHAEPGRRLFYCGSWAHEGVPLLESAVRSARTVVDILQRREHEESAIPG